jgi:AP-3 complex subunit delta-1
LIKKLLPPLTKIIRETGAMSLLYECINGIIQGGILEAVEGTTEGEEVAKLCVGKLRGMMVIEGDANCKLRLAKRSIHDSHMSAVKYVALLAFEKIVRSHPHLVSQQQDVILECIDDPDISIRTRALDLVVGMVNTENLRTIVGRLMRQLRNTPIASSANDPANDRRRVVAVASYAEPDDSDAEETLRQEQRSNQPQPLPEDYRVNVIRRILDMCSRDTYANITDFEWYIDVLVQLVRVSPSTKPFAVEEQDDFEESDECGSGIGRELQNVAIRVKSVRSETIDAAQSLVFVDKRDQMFPSSGNGGLSVLEYAGWLVGEFATYLTHPDAIINSLLHPTSLHLPSKTLAVYLQAIPKVFASMSGNEQVSWTPERKTLMSLLMARIIHFLEPLSTHPNLEVQERAVEYLELMRLASEAASGTETGAAQGEFTEPPLLLTQAIPALFSGAELNPVAPGAQRNVPVPDDLDLDTPINPNLERLLQQAELGGYETDEDDVYAAYAEPLTAHPSTTEPPPTASERLDAPQHKEPTSYQNAVEEEYLDPDIIARRKADRRERYKDDPFYIDPEGRSGSGAITPLTSIVRAGNEEVDIDAIPIMDLELGQTRPAGEEITRARSPRKPTRKVEIMGDETLGSGDGVDSARGDIVGALQTVGGKGKKSLLEVDSSGLGALSLYEEGEAGDGRKMSRFDVERREAEEAEMKRALVEVERLRLEMQRASERLEAKGEVMVRKKKKKVRKVEIGGEEVLMQERERDDGGGGEEGRDEGEGAAKIRKKKKKKVKEVEDADGTIGEGEVGEGEGVVRKKKKKKRTVVLDEGNSGAE